MSIHPTAIVDSQARLASDVVVGPYAVIEADVELAAGVVIGPHVCLHPHTRIGPDTQIHAGAVLGDLPQDTGFSGAPSALSVGRGCTIREGVTIHRGTAPGSTTIIGAACYLMAHSHCAHDVVLGEGVTLANGALLGGHAQVGPRAFISANCLVHQFVRVGELAMLGGGCAVSKDVPPYCLVAPLALNRVAALNTVGLQRAGVAPDKRAALKRAFRLLYRAGEPVDEALRRIRSGGSANLPVEVQRLCEFVASSPRGIAAGR